MDLVDVCNFLKTRDLRLRFDSTVDLVLLLAKDVTRNRRNTEVACRTLLHVSRCIRTVDDWPVQSEIFERLGTARGDKSLYRSWLR